MSMLHEESLLSKETLLELRSEQFNLKRWVSRAMAEAKRNATSASPQPSGLSSGSSPHSPSSPTAPPPTKASAAAGAAAVTDEVVAQQLSTVLGVRKQSAAEGLEETISSALRNLPRATEDVSRLVTESSAMRTKLRDVATSTAKVRDSSSVSEKLRELHEVRNRLITCRTVLNDAQLLASRAAGVEQAITNLYGGSLPNTIASPPTNSTQRGTQRAPTLDMAESNRIADDIAAMRAALRTLQEIDPTYGSSLRTQVDRFEQMMLKGLEAQCLDALKREDKATSPALLAALKKIGREAGVMKQHTDALVAVRIDKFKLEVTAHSGPSVGDKHLPSLRRCLHSLVKALTKDKAFLDEVLASHEASSAAAQVDANFLVTVCERVGSELAAVIPTYTNEGLMTALDIVQQEFTTPLTSGHLASTSTLHCVTSLVNPFVSATTRFADSEIAQIEARASSSKAPGDLHKLEEDLKSSARRVTSYLGALCHFGVHLPAAVQQAKAAMTKCFAAWNKAGLQFASAVGASLPKPAVVGAGSAATRAALESSVAVHAQCGDLQAHVTRLRSELTELVQGVAGPLDISAHTANNFFAPAAAAIADLPTTCRNNVLSTVLEPVKAMLPTKASVAAGTAIAGSQSESVRALGEWVMELPMTLDGAGVVADVQDWVAAAVVYLLKLYSTAVRGILTAPQPAAVPTAASGAPLSTGSTTTGVTKSVSDQLLADIEYLETVVNAIDETPANSQIFTELRQAVATATTS